MQNYIRSTGVGLIAAIGLISCSGESAAPNAAPAAEATAPIPDWARSNIAYMTEGAGRWTADNSAYKSESEPWEAYVIEWRAEPDDLSMTARMYALIDDQPSQADFWSFYQFWDRANGEMRVIQSGWGAVGDGVMTASSVAGTYQAEQVFTAADGTANSVRHETVELSPTEHKTTSFNRSDDGEWVQDRSYRWTRSD